jgi:hypothetical protein
MMHDQPNIKNPLYMMVIYTIPKPGLVNSVVNNLLKKQHGK